MIKRLAFLSWLLLLLGLPTGSARLIQAQEATLPPLTDPGPYGVRLIRMTFVDDIREDWELETFVFYPADKAQGTSIPNSLLLKDAPPDLSDAPYPLIIYSHGHTSHPGEMLNVLAHLTSHGFVVAAPHHHDTNPQLHEHVDRPLDILTVLDNLSVVQEGDLVGMIDTNTVGMMGWSAGAAASLQMVGLESDPIMSARWCAEHPDLSTLDCHVVPLEETTRYRAQLGLENLTDGGWQPFGDARIRAVLAMAPCGFPLTPEDMLATVTTPTMILHGTVDGSCNYEGNAVRSYMHLGTEDRYLITLVKGTHADITMKISIPQHFATAFFGRYLKGDEAYTPYLSAENLPDWTFPKLAWGPYEGE